MFAFIATFIQKFRLNTYHIHLHALVSRPLYICDAQPSYQSAKSLASHRANIHRLPIEFSQWHEATAILQSRISGNLMEGYENGCSLNRLETSTSQAGYIHHVEYGTAETGK